MAVRKKNDDVPIKLIPSAVVLDQWYEKHYFSALTASKKSSTSPAVNPADVKASALAAYDRDEKFFLKTHSLAEVMKRAVEKQESPQRKQ